MIFTAFHGLKRTGGHQAARTINRAHTPMISTLQKLTDPLHGHMQHAATHKWNFTWHTVSNALANIPSFMFINMWNFLCKMFSIKRTKWYHFIGNYLVLSNLYLTFNTSANYISISNYNSGGAGWGDQDADARPFRRCSDGKWHVSSPKLFTKVS